MLRHTLIVFAAVMLASCGIYTNYERPAQAVADMDSLYRPEARPDTTRSIATLRWEELFTDTCLQQLIRQGLAANADLAVARLQVEEAQATLRQSKLAYLPSVQLEPTGTLSSFDGQKTQKTYSVGASASWEIDLFGKLRNSKRQALASLLASDAYRQAMQTQVVATVADSYYALLMLDEQIRITEQTAESWREYVRSLAVLMQAGQADRATLAQAEASRMAAESSLLSLQQQAIEQENALCVFVGLTPRRLERGTMDGQHFPSHLSVGVPLDLLSRRPDVRQAEANLMQAFYATNSARAAFYPSITLSGSAGWTNSGGAVVANPGAWLLQAVGSLVQPLFNRGQNLANLKIAKAQQEEAVLQFRQSLLDAGNEVNNALAQWQTARERIRLDNGQVEQLTITLGDTELLMENSADTNYLQVLTARQSLLSAQLAVASDRYDEIQGVIELYHALGGGSE
ncbi:MAG TPA: efflux transporter outer membrane subunit [Candidatus Bacteroides intestinavium]|uniref:Efflux transporter outer membrane subunit n=1 Tax=Candidatus Bacteroides intestinavium TaxID=2838469 RepID=A0A9D2HRC0_9BACE|nr:efflux transporter outer membrane subunit [Candidatus Bacteroides intestinavium]